MDAGGTRPVEHDFRDTFTSACCCFVCVCRKGPLLERLAVETGRASVGTAFPLLLCVIP